MAMEIAAVRHPGVDWQGLQVVPPSTIEAFEAVATRSSTLQMMLARQSSSDWAGHTLHNFLLENGPPAYARDRNSYLARRFEQATNEMVEGLKARIAGP
jgi:hypothetical protein